MLIKMTVSDHIVSKMDVGYQASLIQQRSL